MISERELLRLVRPVSRSFYLSLIFLPEEVRKELTVGYLMARLADCIADYRGVVGWEQLSLLEELKRNYF
ncbi:MAG: squalene/phytoene synthase family protein, partial [Chthoniobacterales bacterium]|nr:squalene/phytoene synthase family protein [Chthoniobacterales bacterium]